MNDEERAKEAARWTPKEPASTGWVDAPEAHPVPPEEIERFYIPLPKNLAYMLREFAGRAGLNEQVLVKQWLDDRVKVEREKLQNGTRYVKLKDVEHEIIFAIEETDTPDQMKEQSPLWEKIYEALQRLAEEAK